MNREKIIKTTGAKGEEIAMNYLLNNSYKIISRNFHSKYGEIDIIAEKGDTIYFFEVKTRKPYSFTQPEESITQQKISRIIKTAQIFVSRTPQTYTKSWRIMLIGIILDRNILDKNFKITLTEIL